MVKTDKLLELDTELTELVESKKRAIDKRHPMYDLKLNESLEVSTPYFYHMSIQDRNTLPVLFIRRVPGGWIYEYYDRKMHMVLDTAFIPYREEFEYADE